MPLVDAIPAVITGFFLVIWISSVTFGSRKA